MANPLRGSLQKIQFLTVLHHRGADGSERLIQQVVLVDVETMVVVWCCIGEGVNRCGQPAIRDALLRSDLLRGLAGRGSEEGHEALPLWRQNRGEHLPVSP